MTPSYPESGAQERAGSPEGAGSREQGGGREPEGLPGLPWLSERNFKDRGKAGLPQTPLALGPKREVEPWGARFVSRWPLSTPAPAVPTPNPWLLCDP